MGQSNPDIPVKIVKLPIEKIERAEYNPRTIKPEAAAGLLESIKEYGFIDIPVVNEYEPGKYRLIGGHKRLETLEGEGYTHVDVIVVLLTTENEKLANITLNSPHAQGRFDMRLLVPLLDQIGNSAVVRGLYAEPASKAKEQEDDGGTDSVNTGDIDSTPGEVYKLGRHRLLCGDATDPEHLKRLCKRTKFNAIIADPPQGVIGPTDDEDARDTVGSALAMAVEYMRNDGRCVVFTPQPNILPLWTLLGDIGLTQRQLLSWIKAPPQTESPWKPKGSGELNSLVDFIVFACARGVEPTGQADTFRALPCRKSAHPAQKPDELMDWLIAYACAPGDSFLDLFSGSGQGLLAAERQERTCYATEIDPYYCDIIRIRWVQQVHGTKSANWKELTPRG